MYSFSQPSTGKSILWQDKYASFSQTNLIANPDSMIGTNSNGDLTHYSTIPAGLLPSYVDEIFEFTNLAAFPATGVNGKLYFALDSGLVYRWTGSIFVSIHDNTVVDTSSGIYAKVNNLQVVNIKNTSDVPIIEISTLPKLLTNLDMNTKDIINIKDYTSTGIVNCKRLHTNELRNGSNYSWFRWDSATESHPIIFKNLSMNGNNILHLNYISTQFINSKLSNNSTVTTSLIELDHANSRTKLLKDLDANNQNIVNAKDITSTSLVATGAISATGDISSGSVTTTGVISGASLTTTAGISCKTFTHDGQLVPILSSYTVDTTNTTTGSDVFCVATRGGVAAVVALINLVPTNNWFLYNTGPPNFDEAINVNGSAVTTGDRVTIRVMALG